MHSAYFIKGTVWQRLSKRWTGGIEELVQGMAKPGLETVY
jgi:hypothetical protein